MEQEFKKIIDEFIKINKRGYIKSINDQINSCGLTLEHLLGKEADSLFLPDYNGVEIKTTTRFSRYNISLFSLSFDGPNLFESNYLLEKYGSVDDEFSNKKKLFVNLKVNKKILVNDEYYFEFKIDYENEKLYIRIYDKNMNFIEDSAFIYFDTLKKRAEIKLNKMALIYASKRKTCDNLFYRYYRIECFKYKGFSDFLSLLESGIIKAKIILRFARSGNDIGKNKNKNMCFTIIKRRVNKLFNTVFEYEN